MNMETEFKAKFGGIWNSLIILLVIIICLRFSSIELADEDLGTRLKCSLHLFLSPLPKPSTCVPCPADSVRPRR